MRRFLWFVGVFIALPMLLCSTAHGYNDPYGQLGGVLFGLGMFVGFFALLVGVARSLFGTQQRLHERMKRDGLW